MNNHTYQKLDKIVLTESQLKEISKWVALQKFETIDLPLKECFIIVNDIKYKHINLESDMGIYFKSDNNAITIAQYDMKDFSPLFSAKITESFFSDGDFELTVFSKYIKMLSREYHKKVALTTILIVFDIFQYMTHKQDHVVQSNTDRLIKKKKKGKTTSRNKKSNYVKIHSKKYTFDFTRKPTERKYERHMESWTVRGHWRYYKNTGKKVWINSYIKGRGNVKGKVYKI